MHNTHTVRGINFRKKSSIWRGLYSLSEAYFHKWYAYKISSHVASKEEGGGSATKGYDGEEEFAKRPRSQKWFKIYQIFRFQVALYNT